MKNGFETPLNISETDKNIICLNEAEFNCLVRWLLVFGTAFGGITMCLLIMLVLIIKSI